MPYKHALCWLRRDLRLEDNHALSLAGANAAQVTVVFVYDSDILDALSERADRRVHFIAECLASLDAGLRAQGSALVCVHGSAEKEIPALADKLQADAVFCNRDYEPYARKRDASVEKSLKKAGVAFESSKDQVIFESQELRKNDGDPYKVFTPFSKRWLSELKAKDYAEHRVAGKKWTPEKALRAVLRPFTLKSIGFEKASMPGVQGGREAALKHWQHFLDEGLASYPVTKDHFGLAEPSSALSVHIRFGTLSPRELVRTLRPDRRDGAQAWLRQLIWREFYQMLLADRPELVKHPFRKEYEGLKWPGSRRDFEAWKRGETGYPIVDAGMRHLKRCGFLPNRLRLVCASFLCKDLLVDYRWGEKWLAEQLNDFDLASNNGNWQWCASVGCDAQPYFRIFNPILQSKKFDPKAAFIRQEIPELAALDDKAIHWPAGASAAELRKAGVILGKNYPKPLVDHRTQSMKAVALFKKA